MGKRSNDSLLNTRAAAEFLKISEWETRALVRRSQLPCLRYGNGPHARMRFRLDDLRAFVKRSEVKTFNGARLAS